MVYCRYHDTAYTAPVADNAWSTLDFIVEALQARHHDPRRPQPGTSRVVDAQRGRHRAQALGLGVGASHEVITDRRTSAKETAHDPSPRPRCI